MSGYEPGRPKIEEREGAFIWSGTRVLTDTGVEWYVYDTESLGKDGVRLHVKRAVKVRFADFDTEGFDFDTIDLGDYETIRCRVEDEDR